MSDRNEIDMDQLTIYICEKTEMTNEQVSKVLESEIEFLKHSGLKNESEVENEGDSVEFDIEELLNFVVSRTDFTEKNIIKVLDAEMEYLDSKGLIEKG
jgi:hypothetical protein